MDTSQDGNETVVKKMVEALFVLLMLVSELCIKERPRSVLLSSQNKSSYQGLSIV